MILQVVVHDEVAQSKLASSKAGCFIALSPMGKVGGDALLKNVKKEAPKRTRGLEKSFQYRARSIGGTVVADVFATGKYRYIAPMVIRGTRPHLIFGRPILHFIARSGDEVFTYRVKHPGAKPNPFVDRAALKTYNEVGPKCIGMIKSLPMFR